MSVFGTSSQYRFQLQLAPKHLREDPETVRTAVAQDWRALQFAVLQLRSDPEIVRTAVLQNWRALEHASAEMRADPEIVRTAVAQGAFVTSRVPGRAVR